MSRQASNTVRNAYRYEIRIGEAQVRDPVTRRIVREFE